MLTGLLSVWPSHAAAQATINPTRAQFNASPDHNATDASGTALVQSYQIGLYIVGASQPFQSISIGKPNPDGTGTITVDMTAAFLGWPIVGTNYTADVAAVGPGGVARSALSNTFSFTGGGACSFNVPSTSLNVPATSGSYTTTVSTTSGCAWTAVSLSTSWITVTSGSSGTGAWHRGLHRRRQCVYQSAPRDADDRWQDSDGHSGRRLQFHGRADDAKRGCRGRFALGRGDNDERLRLDGRQQ